MNRTGQCKPRRRTTSTSQWNSRRYTTPSTCSVQIMNAQGEKNQPTLEHTVVSPTTLQFAKSKTSNSASRPRATFTCVSCSMASASPVRRACPLTSTVPRAT